jgi:hypothetical protein
MAEYTFDANPGELIKRENLIAYLNTGTSGAPVWSPLGAHVSDSSIEYDWNAETKQDILGDTHTSMKKPTTTQDFDGDLVSGDVAQAKLHNLAVIQQDSTALANLDMMIAHFYVTASGGKGHFAERYSSCAIPVTGLGGEGGGNIGMQYNVTYGGTRTIGSVTKGEDGTIAFIEEAA